jgi:hypothetical protein
LKRIEDAKAKQGLAVTVQSGTGEAFSPVWVKRAASGTRIGYVARETDKGLPVRVTGGTQ